MNTYPGFYRATDGKEYLYLDKSNYFSFERGIWDKSDSCDNHEKDTNITREYLADTKVEIESAEHSRFVQDIVISNGGEWGYGSKSIKFELSQFIVIDSNLKMTIKISSHSFANSENKLVKIPLPPKEPDVIDSLPEVEPKKIFTKEEIKPKGWLNSGCECIYNDEDFIYLCKSPFDGDAVIQRKSSSDWDVISVSFSQLKKPLTPEEELAKELEKMIYAGMDNSYDLNHNCYYLVSGLMKKYDIKKKPE